jgi:hypothetical protein
MNLKFDSIWWGTLAAIALMGKVHGFGQFDRPSISSSSLLREPIYVSTNYQVPHQLPSFISYGTQQIIPPISSQPVVYDQHITPGQYLPNPQLGYLGRSRITMPILQSADNFSIKNFAELTGSTLLTKNRRQLALIVNIGPDQYELTNERCQIFTDKLYEEVPNNSGESQIVLVQRVVCPKKPVAISTIKPYP